MWLKMLECCSNSAKQKLWRTIALFLTILARKGFIDHDLAPNTRGQKASAGLFKLNFSSFFLRSQGCWQSLQFQIREKLTYFVEKLADFASVSRDGALLHI